MKKLLVLLFVIFNVILLSKNLDDYESKQVFDIKINLFLYGDYKSKELYDSINYEKKDIGLKILEIIKVSEDYQYEVMDVEENGNESVLSLKVKFRVITDSRSNILKLDPGLGENQSDVFYIEKAYVRLKNKMKHEFITKEIKVYMQKKDGLWELKDTEENEEYYLTMMLGYTSYIFQLMKD